MEQMGFQFIADANVAKLVTAHQSREDSQRASWMCCWGWAGPVAGEPCDINMPIVKLAEPYTTKGEDGRDDWYHDTIYAYMERCILIEELPDGRWLAEIAMGIVHGHPWGHDGTRVILAITDIWPPTRDIREQRLKEKAA